MDTTPAQRKPVTVRTLARMASNSEPFACLTCYDATTARLLEAAGVHVLLVGDTAAEVILGYPSTVHMPLEISLALTAAVKRGAPTCHVMGDMPFMSYQADDASAMHNAARFLTEGNADSVKMEVDRSFAPLVSKMAGAGVPVCAHIGSRPQTAGLTGGYASAGRTQDAAAKLIDDAKAMQDAGSVLLLIEAVPEEVAQQVIESVSLPVIGIGAGPAPHGQIVVLQDLLGMSSFVPPFAPTLSNVGEQITEAATKWTELVAQRKVTEHRYLMSRG